jgi:hypothetical protein
MKCYKYENIVQHLSPFQPPFLRFQEGDTVSPKTADQFNVLKDATLSISI